MAINQVQSSGADYASGLPSSQKVITLRKYTVDDPLTWDQNDNNFEILRAAINEAIVEINVIDGNYAQVPTTLSTLTSQISTLDTDVQALYTTQSATTQALSDAAADIIALENTSVNQQALSSNLLHQIGEVKTEHVARTYVINHVLIKWKTTTTQSQQDEVTTALGLTYDSDLPLTSFKKYLLPLDGRRDAGYVIPILSLHEYVDIADYNGISASY